MQIPDLLDVHMHTVASVHAYSTIREMVMAAKGKGLQIVGISDHAPAMPGCFSPMYFCNFKVIPRDWGGIAVFMGAELNVMDFCGSTDLPGHLTRRLDYAIASLHDNCIRPGTREENTAALIGAMQNPQVKIIGHPDNPVFPVDYEALACAAKERHVLLEVNNSSYAPNGSRKGSREIVGEMLAACKHHAAKVILDSDAHIEFDVGNHVYAQEMIKKYEFPQELVINSSPDAFKTWIGA